MSDEADYIEIKVNKGYFYQATPQGVKFGTLMDGPEFALSSIEAVFTTGISFNMVPKSLSKDFFKRFLAGVDFYEDNGVFYASCSFELQDLWFMVEEHWIQIRGQDLLTDVSEAQDNTLCIINFLPSVDDFWVFGNTIYKDYYVYHNPERGVLGWVPTAQRFKSPLIKAAPPTGQTLEMPYDLQFLYLKLGVMVAMWVGTAATVIFVFTNTFSGFSFLNKASRTQNSDARSKLIKHLDSMSIESLSKVL